MKPLLISCVLALTAVIFFTAVQSFQTANNPEIAAAAAAEKAALETQLETLQATQSDEKAALDQMVATLQASQQDQDTQLQASLANSEQLKAELADLTAQLSSANAKSAELTADLTTLQSELANKSDVSTDTAASIQSLNATIAQNQDDQAALQTEIDALQTASDEMAAYIAELESNATQTSLSADDQVAALQAQIAQSTDDMTAAQARIAELTDAAAQYDTALSEKDQNVATLTAELQTSAEEVARLTEASDKKFAIIADLQSNASMAEGCQEQSDAVLAGAQITFDTGNTISAASVPLLQDLAVIATECAAQDVVLDIEGHTDNLSGVASNLLQSNGRATAIQDFLQSEGVPKTAMRAIGFGGSEPIADNATEAGQLANKRIVLNWQDR